MQRTARERLKTDFPQGKEEFSIGNWERNAMKDSFFFVLNPPLRVN